MNAFDQVYKIVRQIPEGKVTTYSSIAIAIGRPRQAQMVGWALHCNPDPKTIPCHRVVNASGRLADSFAFGGAAEQKKRLVAEGITFCEQYIVHPSCIINVADII